MTFNQYKEFCADLGFEQGELFVQCTIAKVKLLLARSIQTHCQMPPGRLPWPTYRLLQTYLHKMKLLQEADPDDA